MELISIFVLICIWIYTLLNYATLPETIPTHFNAVGEPNGFGKRSSIFILPVLSFILGVGMLYLSRYPHLYNYIQEITEENALYQYTQASRMIRILNLVITLIFAAVIFKINQNAHGHEDGLGGWFLPMVLIVTFVPIAYYLIKSMKSSSL